MNIVLSSLFLQYGLDENVASFIAIMMVLSVVVFIVLLVHQLSKNILLKGLDVLVNRSKNQWDDILVKHKVFSKLLRLIPGIAAYVITPVLIEGYDGLVQLILSITLIYMTTISVLVIDAILNSALDIYSTFEVAKEIHIKGVVQVIKIFLYFIGIIVILSILLNKTPLYLLSGLGAMTAVLMLVFKDPILGFVAGIHLTANKMVANGDWVEIPKYKIDGEVLEVTLATVKIRNWDNTISMLPTQSLISNNIKNWRGMLESGGRRIKRSIYIDINTIRFCDEAMIKRFEDIQYLSGYIKQKQNDLSSYNYSMNVNLQNPVNGRKLTNVGTFRAYIYHYLKNHPMVNQELTLLVRQLAPTEHGLPIEIYVFCKDKVWVNYEAIQSDIFDHIFAILSEFKLGVYQAPSGNDMDKLVRYGQ